MSNSWISKAARLSIYERDAYTCCYCAKVCCHYNDRTNNMDYATLDHIISRLDLALAHQGIDLKEAIKNRRNLVTVCNACNCSKQETSLYVWAIATGKDFYAIHTEITRRINS